VKDCPSGLKYGQDAGRCDYDSNVPECGGQRPPAEDVVKPP
jgi:hypothetical protein